MPNLIDRERQLRLRRFNRWRVLFGGTALLIVLIASFLWTFSRDDLRRPGVFWDLVALLVLLAPVVGVLALRTWLFRRYVAARRPADTVFALSALAESIVPLREIAPALEAGTTMIASVGVDAIRIWTRRTPTPGALISYSSIQRVWLDAQAPETPVNPYWEGKLRSVVVVEFAGPDRALRQVPMMPAGGAVDRFVEALNERTKLPWLDEPPPALTRAGELDIAAREPSDGLGGTAGDTTTAPEAEAAGAVESSE